MHQDHHVSHLNNPYLRGTHTDEEITFERAFPFEFIEKTARDDDGNPLVFRRGRFNILGHVDPKTVKRVPYRYLVCSDKPNEPVGVPLPETYVHLTNERFWEIVENSVGGTGAKVDGAGTFEGRTRRYITVRVDSDLDEFYVGNRQFQNRFSLFDSVNMKSSLWAVSTSICISCMNSYRVAMRDKKGLFQCKVQHSKNMMIGIANMEQVIDSFVGVTAQFKAALEQAETVPVDRDDATPLFAGFLGRNLKLNEAPSTRLRNTVGRLNELFIGGQGNNGETLLDAFSAVTDYYSHESSGGSDTHEGSFRQYQSSEIGSGARAKEAFFDRLFKTHENGNHDFSRARFIETVNHGRNILARETEEKPVLVSAN
jgi:hypothetical protein